MTIFEKEQGSVQLLHPVGESFVGLGQDLLEDPNSTSDIDELLQRLDGVNIGTGTDESLTEEVSFSSTSPDEAGDVPLSQDVELDFSPGEIDKSSDPIRVYMREMAVASLLTREQEVAIAKRIEWGQKRTQKAITRSPIAVAELLKIGSDLEAERLAIRDVVTFSDQTGAEEHEDRSEEYLQWTIEGIRNIRRLYLKALRESEQWRVAQKPRGGKESKKLLRLKHKLARTRLAIAQEISGLHLKEGIRQRLIGAIGTVSKDIRTFERQIENYTKKLDKKRLKAED